MLVYRRVTPPPAVCRVARGNGSGTNLSESDQIDRIRANLSAVQKRAKFAKVCIRSAMKTVFATKLFGNKKSHSLIM